MWKEAYFAQYKSPNIVIVQTASFPTPPVPPGPKQIAGPIASNCTNCEQVTSVKDNICEPTPSVLNYQQNLQVVNTIANPNTITPTTEFIDDVRYSPSFGQNTVSTDTTLNNISQSVKKKPPISAYQSRNNLVDLTGFNFLKREMSSLSKRKDLKQVDRRSKIEQDKIKTSHEKKHAYYSDSDTSKSKNIFNKKSSTKVKPGNVGDHANAEPKENPVDTEDKMKKYFKHLWNRNVDKLKDTHTSSIKSSSRTRQETKDSKPESSRTKTNSKIVSKTKTVTDLRNKITNSEKYRDLQRRFIAKHSTRSKSETNTRHISKSKESIRDRNVDLSPVSSKRYKDFKRFKHGNDHESKYKSGNQNKTESLAQNKMVRMESHETIINKRDIKKNEADHKQSVKNEKHGKVSTNQTNMERLNKKHTNIERARDDINKKVNLVKNVAQVHKNKPDNLTQSKCANEVEDLRSRLSRKRTRSECYAHSHESMENRLDRENLVITVKQDIKADSNNSVSVAPNVSKPNKCKKLKLIIHIEYPNSDPDDSDQDINERCPSPEDLSFLDDFNVDEIVDSLNNSQVEDDKVITTDNAKSQDINKINENYNTKKKCNEETKPKNDLDTTKAIQIKKTETSLQKGQVIEINTNAEDVALNLQIGSVTNTWKCKDGQKLRTYSRVKRNIKQEVNNKIDFTKDAYKESALKKTMDLCNDGNDSVTKVIDISDENKLNTISKHSFLERNVNLVKSNKDVSNVDRIFELLRQPDKQSAKTRQGCENTTKKSHNTVNTSYGEMKTELIRKHEDKTSLVTVENTFDITAKQTLEPSDIKDQKQTHLRISKDSNKASPFKHNEQKKYVNKNRVKSDVIKQLNTKYVKKENAESQNTKDAVEVSLRTMFNDVEQNGSIRKHIEPNRFNGCGKKANESSNIQKPVDAVELSLESIFNSPKKAQSTINMDVEPPSLSRQHIKKETTQLKVDVPFKARSNTVDQNPLNKIKINLSNKTKKRIETGPEYSEKTVNETLTKTNKNCMKQKANININAETSNVSQITPPCKPEKHIAKNTEHFRKYENTQASNKSIQEKMHERPPGTENSTKKTLSLNSCGEIFMATHEKDIRPQSSLSKNKVKGETLQKSKQKMGARENSSQRPEKKINKLLEKPIASEEKSQKKVNINNKKDTDKPINTMEKKTNNVMLPTPVYEKSNGPENSTNKPLGTTKSTLENILSSPQIDVRPQSKSSQKSKENTKISSKAIDICEQLFENKSKNPLEPKENLPEKKANNKIDIIPLCTPNEDVKQHLQTFEIPDKKSTDKPSDIIEMETNNVRVYVPLSNKYCQETEKTLQNMKILVENSQMENNRVKTEPLQISEETLSTSEAIITDGDQKTNITSGFNMSDKNKEEQPLLLLEDTDAISKKTPETDNSVEKNNVCTSIELTNPDKNTKDTDEKISIIKTDESLMTSNEKILPTSSNVENQAKTLETVKNEDDLTRTKDSNIEKTNKNSDLGKHCEIATNYAAKQEQVTNESVVAVNKKDEGISIKYTPLITKLEARVRQFLGRKFSVSSVIKEGQYSSIFKCNDIQGETYAVKVNNASQVGINIKDMLFQLQQYIPKRVSCILHLMGAFEIQGQWCLLTEYFPKNLKQALIENKRSFHIDRVQCLSKQLVDAVNMLTNAGIIHSDIKPTHILMNGAHDRLKLCGFDRSNYSVCMTILPNAGTSCYRAPEVILGFITDHRIDVWSTAMVMFKMATNKTLFPPNTNNTILFNQIRTFGSMEMSMVEQSRYGHLYFSGTSYIREIKDKKHRHSFLVHSLHEDDRFPSILYESYFRDWSRERSNWEKTRDLAKLKKFLLLMGQMLNMDPRKRIPIQFVYTSDFMDHQFTIP